MMKYKLIVLLLMPSLAFGGNIRSHHDCVIERVQVGTENINVRFMCREYQMPTVCVNSWKNLWMCGHWVEYPVFTVAGRNMISVGLWDKMKRCEAHTSIDVQKNKLVTISIDNYMDDYCENGSSSDSGGGLVTGMVIGHLLTS